MKKKKVILVTDGDNIAKEAVKRAAEKVGGTCISESAGNPTPLTGSQIVELIKRASKEPIIIMADDCGDAGKGKGESAMSYLIKEDSIQVLGVVAVASNCEGASKIKVDCSFTKDGQKINYAVDKYGNNSFNTGISGDTLSVLEEISVPIIVGIGDPGKMDGKDDAYGGAPVTTLAIEEILKVNRER